MDGGDGVDLVGVDAMGGAEGLGKFEFVVIQIDGDDRVRAGDLGAHHCRQTDSANAENHHALPGLHGGRVDHRAGAGHHRTADDGGHIFVDTGVCFDHVLFIADRVIGPGKHVLGHGFAVTDIQPGAGG